MVSVTASCTQIAEFFGGSSEKANSDNSQTVEWPVMSQQVTNLLHRIDSEDAAEWKVNDVAAEVRKPLALLGKNNDELKIKCGECKSDVLKQADGARNSLQSVADKLTKEKSEVLPTQLKNEIRDLLASAHTSLEEANRLSQPPKGPTILERLVFPAQILGVVVALVVVAGALMYLWKRSWETVEFNVAQMVKNQLAATRQAQPDYAAKLSSLSSAQAEMSGRLTQLETEVRSLVRLVRESLSVKRYDRSPSYDGMNYQSHVAEVPQRDEPDFPISAVDYLDRMTRFANVVRPDFQNGILVNASDGDGELVLIRDSRDDTQPLFVVPRATQFHTKQDFYTYYQKYYNCDRPSAGDVWIIGPATVEKVAGGWQLREKGMLEVR
jgi:hypothetical protein